MRKRKVKSMLATLVAVLVLSGVFMASAAEGTGTGTRGAADSTTTGSTTVTPSEPEKPTEPTGNIKVEDGATNQEVAEAVVDVINKTDSDTVTIEVTAENITLSKDVFTAAKNADKEIVIKSGDVTWTFGKITDPDQEVKVAVTPATLEASKSENKAAIQKLVKNTGAAVLTFENSGKLPGEAIISVPVEKLFPGSTQKTFYAYHYNAGKLEPVGVAKVVDGVLSFSIDHNSDYVITDTRLATATTTTRPSGAADGKKIDEHIVGGSSSSAKDNPHTGAY